MAACDESGLVSDFLFLVLSIGYPIGKQKETRLTVSPFCLRVAGFQQPELYLTVITELNVP